MKLNWFEHCNILEHIEDLKVVKLLKLFKKSNVLYKYSKDKKGLTIIHKCTKRQGYQASYFILKNNNYIAFSDVVRSDLKELIKERI